jgi:hypothetical protein
MEVHFRKHRMTRRLLLYSALFLIAFPCLTSCGVSQFAILLLFIPTETEVEEFEPERRIR